VRFLSLVLTNAEPLPGFTCRNSSTLYTLPSAGTRHMCACVRARMRGMPADYPRGHLRISRCYTVIHTHTHTHSRCWD
jgi:hypothetical protein